MSLLDAQIPRLIASHTALAANTGLMRHTIGQADADGAAASTGF
ncbi:hypothetical protein [Mycobacterium decipiens]